MASGNRFFDDFTRLVGDATGAAQGMRREVETLVKAQIERFLRDMDVANREELAVLRDQVADLRSQTEALRDRVATLEGSPPNAAGVSAPPSAGSADDAASGAAARKPRGTGRAGAPPANDIP